MDVIGILPAPDEVRAILADADPPIRAKLIDRLLARHESADYWALKWGGLSRITSEYQSACMTKLAAGAITPPHRCIHSMFDRPSTHADRRGLLEDQSRRHASAMQTL